MYSSYTEYLKFVKTININDYFIIGVNDINKLNIHIDILLLVDKKIFYR